MNHEIAQLRHLYANMVNGCVKDSAAAKRIAEGLLAPVIESLERHTDRLPLCSNQINVLEEARSIAMEFTAKARVPECGEFGKIAQSLDWLVDTVKAEVKKVEVLKSAEKTLRQMGYTNKGGEYWKPPIGKAPDFDLVHSLDKQIDALQAGAEQDEALIRQMLDAIESIRSYGSDSLDDWLINKLDEAIDAVRKQGGG